MPTEVATGETDASRAAPKVSRLPKRELYAGGDGRHKLADRLNIRLEKGSPFSARRFQHNSKETAGDEGERAAPARAQRRTLRCDSGKDASAEGERAVAARAWRFPPVGPAAQAGYIDGEG